MGNRNVFSIQVETPRKLWDVSRQNGIVGLCKLQDGTLILDKFRSSDGGKNWEPIKVVTPADPKGSFFGGMTSLPLKNGRILLFNAHCDWKSTDKDNGQFSGLLWHSDDNGKSFSGPAEIPVSLPRGANQGKPSTGKPWPLLWPCFWQGIIELDNGDLLATMYGCLEGDPVPCPKWPDQLLRRSFLVISKDGGYHWNYLSTIAYDPQMKARKPWPEDCNYISKTVFEGFPEPDMARCKNGSLLVVMRVGKSGYPLYQCRSADNGNSWSEPEKTEMIGVAPKLLRLSNGGLACSYGRPGDSIAFSPDGEGKNWTHQTVVYSGNSVGYTCLTEIEPNVLFLYIYSIREKIALLEEALPGQTHKSTLFSTQIRLSGFETVVRDNQMMR